MSDIPKTFLNELFSLIFEFYRSKHHDDPDQLQKVIEATERNRERYVNGGSADDIGAFLWFAGLDMGLHDSQTPEGLKRLRSMFASQIAQSPRKRTTTEDTYMPSPEEVAMKRAQFSDEEWKNGGCARLAKQIGCHPTTIRRKLRQASAH